MEGERKAGKIDKGDAFIWILVIALVIFAIASFLFMPDLKDVKYMALLW